MKGGEGWVVHENSVCDRESMGTVLLQIRRILLECQRALLFEDNSYRIRSVLHTSAHIAQLGE